MSTVRRRAWRVLAVVAAVGLTVPGTLAAAGGSDDSGDVRITAVMADATPLRSGHIVRAAGVEVGTIDSVVLGDDGAARVAMTVGREVLPLHQDATVSLITQDLLGERYLAIESGSVDAPLLAEPFTIPLSQTEAVDLQDVVNVVDDPTGTALAMMLTTLGEGVGQNPQEVADTIAALEPAMRQTDDLATLLSEQNELLSNLVQTAQPVATAVATERGESLDRLVGSTTQMLSATAENQKEIRESLERLPGTLASAQQTLAEVAQVAEPATRTLAGLRPITDDLTDISAELQRFSDAADPALASLRPVLDTGNEMLDELGPLVQTLKPAGPDLRGVTASYNELADKALSSRLVDLMEFMKGWSLSTSDYDAVSHYFRAVTPYTPKTAGVTGAGPIPGAPESPVPDLPLPGGGRTPLPGAEGAPAEPNPPPSLPGGVTGLSEQQEQSMVGQLLGGGQ